jgi:hypothetical protein
VYFFVYIILYLYCSDANPWKRFGQGKLWLAALTGLYMDPCSLGVEFYVNLLVFILLFVCLFSRFECLSVVCVCRYTSIYS